MNVMPVSYGLFTRVLLTVKTVMVVVVVVWM